MPKTEIVNTGDIVAIPGSSEARGRPRRGGARFLGVPGLACPADLSVAKVSRKYYVIIPEHASGAVIPPEDDEVTVVELRGAQ